jgi:hypothetical protein
MAELHCLIRGGDPGRPLFLNRYGDAMTRFGVHELVARYAEVAAEKIPSLKAKRISPHVVRHYVPFLTMSCNRSLAQYFRPIQEPGDDIVLTDTVSPVPE